jgi:hypothetical protein
VYDILGGAGAYATLGARLFSPPPLSTSVGWIVDCGSDFPEAIRETILKWQTTCLLRETPERLTTRGWNEYGDNEYRGPFLSHPPRGESLIKESIQISYTKAASRSKFIFARFTLLKKHSFNMLPATLH